MKLKPRLMTYTLALAGVLLAGSAVAGHPEGKGPRHAGAHGPEKHLARLAESLDLSDEQSEEMLIVLQAAEEERRALLKRQMEEARPEVCAQRQATHDQILAILTSEQAEEFEAMMAEHEERSFGRGPRGNFMDFDCGDAG